MPDLDTPLDRSIRDLVARAVADAPSAPTIDERTAADRRPVSAARDRNRWIVGGLAGLSVAAALVALFLWARPDDLADPFVPATVPPPTTGPAASVSTDPPSTTTTVPAATTELQASVVAGPDGVSIAYAGGAPQPITGEPMTLAAVTRDGRVFMQRVGDPRFGDARQAIRVVDPATGTDEPLALAGDLLGTTPLLHDAADVDGEVVLIVQMLPEACDAPDGCDGSLWAVWPDRPEARRLATASMWESGWSRLDLAATGVAVGTWSAEVSADPFVIDVDGGSPIDFTALGVQTGPDCSTCDAGFTIDPSGRFLAWIARDLVTSQNTLTIASLDGSSSFDVPLVGPDGAVCCLDAAGPDLPVAPSIVLSQVGADEGTVFGTAWINADVRSDGPPPLRVDLTTGEVSVAGPGTTITIGVVERGAGRG